MAFLIKSMLPSNPLKGMGLGGGEEPAAEAAPSDPAKAAGMTREEYEEYQKQVVEEKWVEHNHLILVLIVLNGQGWNIYNKFNHSNALTLTSTRKLLYIQFFLLQ